VKGFRMVELIPVDWVMERRSPLGGFQNLSIEWNKEIWTRFLGNKEVVWKEQELFIPFHTKGN